MRSFGRGSFCHPGWPHITRARPDLVSVLGSERVSTCRRLDASVSGRCGHSVQRFGTDIRPVSASLGGRPRGADTFRDHAFQVVPVPRVSVRRPCRPVKRAPRGPTPQRDPKGGDDNNEQLSADHPSASVAPHPSNWPKWCDVPSLESLPDARVRVQAAGGREKMRFNEKRRQPYSRRCSDMPSDLRFCCSLVFAGFPCFSTCCVHSVSAPGSVADGDIA
jgi:hypothetical protein